MRLTDQDARYAVLADLHLGSPRSKKNALSHVSKLRREGYRIIWAGDVFDLWRDKDAVEKFRGILAPGDIFIPGNHDWSAQNWLPAGVTKAPTGVIVIQDGRVIYITHGDMVDFGYAAHLLAHTRRRRKLAGEIGDNPVVNFVASLYPWKETDVYRFYRGLEQAPAWAVAALEHGVYTLGKRLRAAAAIVLGLVQAFQQPRLPNQPMPFYLGKGDDGEPILVHSSTGLVRRLQAAHSAALDAEVIVMGHMHRTRLHDMKGPYRVRQLHVLGAWVEGCTSTYVTIEQGQVKRHLVKDL